MRIGVFVCHCGSNIAGTLDPAQVAAAARTMPGVAHSADLVYACAEPGQKAIEAAVREHGLTGVVVASCSPRMHEPTFRKVVARAGLNPYMFEMANIREHVSWIGKDREANTRKAAELVRVAVEKLRRDQPLTPERFPVTKRVLIIGAGIAGIQAALDCAEAGLEVALVEKAAWIGGKMAKLDKTFPTIDCSSCILGPKMVEVAQHPRIRLHALAEVEDVTGFVGNFRAVIRKRAPLVDWSLCTGCGECARVCPVRTAPDPFNENLRATSAISIPFPQAVPKKAHIRADACLRCAKGVCGKCAKVCPTQAIRYDQQDDLITEEVGAVIVATGYDLVDWSGYGHLGGGRLPDVITGLQYERMLSASGPTAGHVRRPSDGKEPKNIVFIQCVGSRDPARGKPSCSGFCCMYTAKQAILTREHCADARAYVFYMDIRSPGKLYDEFTRRAMETDGITYIRGRVGRIARMGGGYRVFATDTLAGTQVEVQADMVVLAVGAQGADSARALAERLRISCDEQGFFMEGHPKLRPLETNTAGIFLAGACQGPKDIPSSVAQGSGAAAKALCLFARDMLESDPQTAHVQASRCVGCGKCVRTCPFQAIRLNEVRGRTVAEVTGAVCRGCGLCAATCPQGAAQVRHCTDNQILAEIAALCPF